MSIEFGLTKELVNTQFAPVAALSACYDGQKVLRVTLFGKGMVRMAGEGRSKKETHEGLIFNDVPLPGSLIGNSQRS